MYFSARKCHFSTRKCPRRGALEGHCVAWARGLPGVYKLESPALARRKGLDANDASSTSDTSNPWRPGSWLAHYGPPQLPETPQPRQDHWLPLGRGPVSQLNAGRWGSSWQVWEIVFHSPWSHTMFWQQASYGQLLFQLAIANRINLSSSSHSRTEIFMFMCFFLSVTMSMQRLRF